MQMVGCILGKRLLILGGGPDQFVGILKCKEMGITSIVLDGKEDAYCKAYADEFYCVSIKHLNQIDKFLDSYKKRIDGVIAFGVDIPFIISYVADKLDVNYTIPLVSTKLSENKFLAKEFMYKNSIYIPKYELVKSAEDIKNFISEVGLPIVLKPVDNSGARGISVLDDISEVEKYFNYALKNSNLKQVIIEKFLSGPQISTESFVINGKVYNIGFADRNYDNMEKFLPNIIENGGDLPSQNMKEEHKEKLKKYLEIISRELNIKNGVIKGDIVIHNNSLYIIEFALRLSGGNFSTIEIPESTGVDFLKIAIKLHLGMEVDIDELKVKKNNNISLRYKFLEEIGVKKVQHINVPAKRDNIIDYKVYIEEGDKVLSSKTENHLQRIAYGISKAASRDDAINKVNDFLEQIKIK